MKIIFVYLTAMQAHFVWKCGKIEVAEQMVHEAFCKKKKRHLWLKAFNLTNE